MFFATVYTRLKSKVKYLELQIKQLKKDVAKHIYVSERGNNQ